MHGYCRGYRVISRAAIAPGVEIMTRLPDARSSSTDLEQGRHRPFYSVSPSCESVSRWLRAEGKTQDSILLLQRQYQLRVSPQPLASTSDEYLLHVDVR